MDKKFLNRAILPILYVYWYENLEYHEIGPFFSITPQGTGVVIGQNWITLDVVTEKYENQRVTVPYSFSINAKNPFIVVGGVIECL